jgi:hypothetical protein
MNWKAIRKTDFPRRCRQLLGPGLAVLVLALAVLPCPAAAQPPAAPNPSTLLGGSARDTAYGLAVDEQGAVYVAGSTASSDFPITPGALDTSRVSMEAFLVKFSPEGTLEYATFLGGKGDDAAHAVAVENGIAYVTGETTSSDFPGTEGALGESDAFVVAVNGDGSGLLWAARLGGTDQDRGYGLAVEAGSAYVTGITYSPDFPGGSARNGDAFVARVDAGGAVAYSTLLSGADVDAGFAVAVRGGETTVVGETSSFDWVGGGKGGRDGFVARLDETGGVVWNFAVGGTGDDRAQDLCLDPGGNVYVTGWAGSSDFPATVGSYSGGTDAFVLRVGADGALAWALLVGGSGADEGRGIILDAAGSLVVTGATGSDDFPVSADASQAGLLGAEDAFFLRFEPGTASAPAVRFGTLVGGSGRDRGLALTSDPSGAAWAAGLTTSADFYTTAGALSQELRGSQDAFLSRWETDEPVGPQPADTATAGSSPTASSGVVGATGAATGSAVPATPASSATDAAAVATGQASATALPGSAAESSPGPSSLPGTASSASPAVVTPGAAAEGTGPVALQASPGATSAPISSSPEGGLPASSETESAGVASLWIWAVMIAAVIGVAVVGWFLLRKR